jgi:hypothetical protein
MIQSKQIQKDCADLQSTSLVVCNTCKFASLTSCDNYIYCKKHDTDFTCTSWCDKWTKKLFK